MILSRISLGLVLVLSICSLRNAREFSLGEKRQLLGNLKHRWQQGDPRTLQLPGRGTADAQLARKTSFCEWCAGKADGLHAARYASPPCSGYFECRRQHLRAVHSCPKGLFFNEDIGSCVASEISSCHVSNGESRGRVLAAVAPADASLDLTSPDWTEVNALLAFKANVIDFAGILDSWVVPATTNATNVCRWNGVSCNPRTRRVINVTLAGQQLSGLPSVLQSIPAEFGNLTELATLDLSGDPLSIGLTGLTGPIPPELGQCAGLSFLHLGSNQLVGPLPESIANLTKLTDLSVATNYLSGPLPSGIGKLVALTSLDLSANFFNGSLPVGLGSIAALSTLNLGVNNFTGPVPATLGNLQQLSSLDLHFNNFSGPVPDWIGNLPGLFYVDLSSNSFAGTIPASVAKSQSLGALNLGTNLLGGPIPAAILCPPSGSSLLSGLDLSANSFTGLLPKELANCPGMSFLYLHSNQLTGTIPLEWIRAWTQSLSYIDVGNNSLSGPIPAGLLQMPLLTDLHLDNNQFSGTIPPLGCATIKDYALGTLWLSNNSLTGAIPATIGPKCTLLNDIRLSGNKLSGTVPVGVSQLVLYNLILGNNSLSGPPPVPRNCSLLIQLDLSSNAFSGPLPEQLANCTSLAMLDLSDNQLSGPLPDSVSKWGGDRSLLSLNLAHNALNGALPPSIVQLQALSSLNLSTNAFDGPIPPSIGNISRLNQLDLSRNSLSGAIPPTLGNLTVLRTLLLDSNALSGDIPGQLAPPFLPRLQQLNLSSNKLTGVIPFGFEGIAPNVTLDFSNNSLSGAVPAGNLTSFPQSAFAGNQGLCGGQGYPACPSTGGTKLSGGAIAGIVIGAVAGLIVILLATWWFMRKRNDWAGGTMLVFQKLDFRLTVDSIIKSTDNFSDKYLLGRGGFGSVYKATLEDGRTVAIKRLASQSTQGDREVEAEMSTLGNIRHRNLVTLVAAYIAPPPSNERLLIYNFLSGGGLDSVLAKDIPKESPLRQWQIRRRIALDTARGMKYLHHDCNPRIIHRDMKPANILLDDQLVAYVADFGLAREMDMTRSHMSTAVFGTIGYLAPEYTQRGRLTFKSDVFAYGVLLLQLITGKQPTDEEVAERGLARWVGAHSAANIVDSRISDAEQNIDQITGAIKLGLLCTSRVAADRPTMAEVVHLLENLEDFAKGIHSAAPS